MSEKFYSNGFVGLKYIPINTRLAIFIAANVYKEIGKKLKKMEKKHFKKKGICDDKLEKILITFKSLLLFFFIPLINYQYLNIRDTLPNENLNAAIIGLGTSGLAVNKLIYDDAKSDVIAFEVENIHNRNNFFGFWLTDWMIPYEKLIEKKWYQWSIGNSKTDIVHKDNINPYCVISFKNLERILFKYLQQSKNKNKKVIEYFQTENYFTIITDDKKYFAKKIYDSSNQTKNNELSQQFLGLNIVSKNINHLIKIN